MSMTQPWTVLIISQLGILGPGLPVGNKFTQFNFYLNVQSMVGEYGMCNTITLLLTYRYDDGLDNIVKKTSFTHWMRTTPVTQNSSPGHKESPLC